MMLMQSAFSMMDNILSSKLYRPGSIAYVSKSGGMSNELNNILALCKLLGQLQFTYADLLDSNRRHI